MILFTSFYFIFWASSLSLSLMSFTLMTMEAKLKSIEYKKTRKGQKKSKSKTRKTIAMETASQLKNTNEIKSVWPCFLGKLRRLDCYVNVIQ